MMSTYALRWNDFQANISSALKEIKDDPDLFDVSIVCEDNEKHVEAHKLILSACSPFFRTLLKKLKHSHPLLYLRGVNYRNLVSIMSFLYNGEVNVCQDDLNSFLASAEDLKIKGLTQNPDKLEDKIQKSPVNKNSHSKEISVQKSLKPFPFHNEQNLKEDDADEVTEVQPTLPVKVEPHVVDNIVSNDDYSDHAINTDDYGEEAFHYEGANELFHSSGAGITLDSVNKGKVLFLITRNHEIFLGNI